MGIAFAGAMAGYGLAPPCQWMITRFGWRAALASYAVLVAALIPLAWTVLPPRLGTAGRQPATHAARAGGSGVRAIVGAAPFWLLFVVLTMPPIFGGLATTQHALYHDGARVLTRPRLGHARRRRGPGRGRPRAIRPHVRPGRRARERAFVSFGSTLLGLGCLLGLEATSARLLAYGYVLFLFLPMGSRATIGSVLVGRIAPPAQYGLVFGLLGIGNSLGSAPGASTSQGRSTTGPARTS